MRGRRVCSFSEAVCREKEFGFWQTVRVPGWFGSAVELLATGCSFDAFKRRSDTACHILQDMMGICLILILAVFGLYHARCTGG